MKKLFTSALLLVTMAASATNWQAIQDSDDGSRLLMDSDSYAEGKADDGTATLAGKFRYFVSGEMRPEAAYVVFTDSCKAGNGLLFMRTYDGEKWVTANKYWWAKNGSKMYDVIGNFLCDVHKLREALPTKSKSNGRLSS
jgi:hypothetical protein